MEKPSTKKPMNILKTMVFLNNFMKKGDFKLRAGDTWKTHIVISTCETIWLNQIELAEIVHKALNDYFQKKKQQIVTLSKKGE